MEKDLVLKSTQIRVVLRSFYMGILPEYKAIPTTASIHERVEVSV
jgi:hypothetical protein